MPLLLLSDAAADADGIQKSLDALKQRNGLILKDITDSASIEELIRGLGLKDYILAWETETMAVLSFSTPAELSRALECLGGGRRSAAGDIMYRVEVPRKRQPQRAAAGSNGGGIAGGQGGREREGDGISAKEWAEAKLTAMGVDRSVLLHHIYG